MVASADRQIRREHIADPCRSGGRPRRIARVCQNCHHNAVMPVDPVLARYRPTTSFPEVKGGFLCLV
jgi:hypothetical protein